MVGDTAGVQPVVRRTCYCGTCFVYVSPFDPVLAAAKPDGVSTVCRLVAIQVRRVRAVTPLVMKISDKQNIVTRVQEVRSALS